MTPENLKSASLDCGDGFGSLAPDEAEAVRKIRERKAAENAAFESWWSVHLYDVRDTSEREQYSHDKLKTAARMVWNGARATSLPNTQGLVTPGTGHRDESAADSRRHH